MRNLTNAPVLATNSNGLIVEGEFPDYTDVYLNKVNNDTAAGNITFEKISRHRGGISVGSSDQANLYIQVGDTKSIALHPRGDSTPVSIGYNSTDTVYQAVTTLPDAIDKKNRNGYQVNLSRNNTYVSNNQEVKFLIAVFLSQMICVA